MYSKLKRYRLHCTIKRIATTSFGLTITLGLFALAQTLIFGSRFGANDDFGMAQIANGGFTGKPSEYLIFINVILGHFLKLCYQIAPSVQWYPLLQVLSMAFAFAVFIHLGFIVLKSLAHHESLLNWSLISTLFVVVFSQFIVWVYTINFSTTAYFCSTLGLSAVLLSLRINPNVFALTPIFVCFLGFLWRPQAFMSAVPIFLLVLFFQFRKVPSLSLVKNVSLLAFVIFLASYLDQLAYTSSDKWRAFYEYNMLRGKIHANFVFSSLIDRYGLTEIASRLWIPEVNLRLFGAWFYSSSTTTVDALERANHLIDQFTEVSKTRIGPIAQSQAKGVFFVIAPLLTLILFAYSRLRITFFALLLLLFAYLILAESYLEQFLRLPGYVIEGLRFSTLIGLILLLIFALVSVARRFQPNHYLRFFMLLSFFPFALYSIHLIRTLPEVSMITKLQQQQSLESAQQFQNSFSTPTIDFIGFVNTSESNPWSSFKLSSLNVITVGWAMSSPHETERLRLFGVYQDLDKAVGDGDISVLSLPSDLSLVYLSEFLFANYRICGTWDSTSITFRDQPVLLSVFKMSGDCSSVVNSDPQLEQGEVFFANDEVHLRISTCINGVAQNQISFNAHSPFGSYAQDFRIMIDYLGPFMAPTTRYVTVKPGVSQQLIVDTWGCEVRITSLSPPVVPYNVNPKIPDRRTLFVGISDLTILAK